MQLQMVCFVVIETSKGNFMGITCGAMTVRRQVLLSWKHVSEVWTFYSVQGKSSTSTLGYALSSLYDTFSFTLPISCAMCDNLASLGALCFVTVNAKCLKWRTNRATVQNLVNVPLLIVSHSHTNVHRSKCSQGHNPAKSPFEYWRKNAFAFQRRNETLHIDVWPAT